MHCKLQLILYYRSKTKYCQRLLEDDLATKCYSNSNVDELNGRRKGSVFLMYCVFIRKIKSYFNVFNYNQTLKVLATKGNNSLPYTVVCLYRECYSKPYIIQKTCIKCEDG